MKAEKEMITKIILELNNKEKKAFEKLILKYLGDDHTIPTDNPEKELGYEVMNDLLSVLDSS